MPPPSLPLSWEDLVLQMGWGQALSSRGHRCLSEVVRFSGHRSATAAGASSFLALLLSCFPLTGKPQEAPLPGLEPEGPPISSLWQRRSRGAVCSESLLKP